MWDVGAGCTLPMLAISSTIGTLVLDEKLKCFCSYQSNIGIMI